MLIWDKWVAWRAARAATASAQQALRDFKRLQADHPDLKDRPLYELFVRQRNGIEAAAARSILHRAENSFALWPEGRTLIFRDIVQYLVISEYRDAHPNHAAGEPDLACVVSPLIPSDL
jgi:hypothetical protein